MLFIGYFATFPIGSHCTALRVYPANQFKTNDWLVSVVNTAAFNDNVTNRETLDFKSEKLSITIDDKPYYLWCIKGKDEYSIF